MGAPTHHPAIKFSWSGAVEGASVPRVLWRQLSCKARQYQATPCMHTTSCLQELIAPASRGEKSGRFAQKPEKQPCHEKQADYQALAALIIDSRLSAHNQGNIRLTFNLALIIFISPLKLAWQADFSGGGSCRAMALHVRRTGEMHE